METGTIRAGYNRRKNLIWSIGGMLAASATVLPYFLLGTRSTLKLQDQMDGELLNYIYRARYLFRGDVIPEFMNGMSKAAMIPPAPFGVLLFKALPPFAAFVALQWLVSLVAFLGMRGLCKYLGVREEMASLTAVLFSLIPFYPVYGLSVPGEPLLVLCWLRLLEGGKKRLPLAGIFLCAGFSSLALVGYAWVALGALLTLILFFGDRKEKKKPNRGWRCLMAWGCLTSCFLATNLELITSLGSGGFVTHRTEMTLHALENPMQKMLELLLEGGPYHPVYSAAVLALTAVLLSGLAAGKLLRRRQGADRQTGADERQGIDNRTRADRRRGADDPAGGELPGRIALVASVIAADILLATLWNCDGIVRLRKLLGGFFVYFQADRISWSLPFLWMLLLAWDAELLCRMIGACRGRSLPADGKEGRKRSVGLPRRMAGIGLCGIGLVLFVTEGALILRDSTLNKNIRLLVVPGYRQLSWEGFYMEDVFAEIDRAVGEDKEQVSVVSLGISPAVALYNGYTCADGYSNNYDLEYKHAFRRIVAAELDKREEVRESFDGWGNRLYLATAQYGLEALVSKSFGVVYRDLSFDMDAMRDLNIGYILAAAPIENAEELGLTLVRDVPFSSETSYYEVWLYRLL